jgi:hypothetical protein
MMSPVIKLQASFFSFHKFAATESPICSISGRQRDRTHCWNLSVPYTNVLTASWKGLCHSSRRLYWFLLVGPQTTSCEVYVELKQVLQFPSANLLYSCHWGVWQPWPGLTLSHPWSLSYMLDLAHSMCRLRVKSTFSTLCTAHKLTKRTYTLLYTNIIMWPYSLSCS